MDRYSLGNWKLFSFHPRIWDVLTCSIKFNHTTKWCSINLISADNWWPINRVMQVCASLQRKLFFIISIKNDLTGLGANKNSRQFLSRVLDSESGDRDTCYWCTPWFHLEHTVLLIGTLLVFDPVLTPKYWGDSLAQWSKGNNMWKLTVNWHGFEPCRCCASTKISIFKKRNWLTMWNAYNPCPRCLMLY